MSAQHHLLIEVLPFPRFPPGGSGIPAEAAPSTSENCCVGTPQAPLTPLEYVVP